MVSKRCLWKEFAEEIYPNPKIVHPMINNIIENPLNAIIEKSRRSIQNTLIREMLKCLLVPSNIKIHESTIMISIVTNISPHQLRNPINA